MAKDHEGREGEAVEYGDARMIFDARTHDVLEQQYLYPGDSGSDGYKLALDKGDPVGWVTVLDQGIVDSVDERPR